MERVCVSVCCVGWGKKGEREHSVEMLGSWNQCLFSLSSLAWLCLTTPEV